VNRKQLIEQVRRMESLGEEIRLSNMDLASLESQVQAARERVETLRGEYEQVQSSIIRATAEIAARSAY
jgi:predicted  nucleic acid-binding Zn-ribbon protein